MEANERIEEILHRYETAGLVEGDAEKVLALIADDIIGVGMGEQGFIYSKAQIREIVVNTIKKDETATYELEFENVLINLVKDTAANLCAKVIVKRVCNGSGKVSYSAFHQSLSLVFRNNDWYITALHASPVELTTESIESYPMTFADNTLSQLRTEVKEQALELMSKSISGGLIGVYIADNAYPLYIVNDSMLSYLEYTEEEFREIFGDDVSRIIAEEDLKTAESIIGRAMIDRKDFELHARVMKKDGACLTMIAVGRFTEDSDGKPVLLGLFTDVTQMAELNLRLEKQTGLLEEQSEELSAQNEELLVQQETLQKQSEELAISEERFRIALEKTSNIIFDCDIVSGNIIHSSTPKQLSDFATNINEAKTSLIIGGVITEEYLPEFNRAFSAVKNGGSQAECIVKARMAAGREVWYRISMTGIPDSSGRNVRAIGMIEDITLQKEAEQAGVELRRRSERDSLTGIYNKGASEQKITDLLHKEDIGKSGIFIMMDIDSFKEVNDTYGHPFGDKILKKAAEVLLNNFRDMDIIGRIGGDEFCIFCHGIQSRKNLEKLLEAVSEQIRGILVPKQGKTGISGSMGIARCDGIEKDFDRLYKEADIALYETKKRGKNGFTFYEDIHKNT